MPPKAHSMIIAANVLHHAVRHAYVDPLVVLTSQRWALEGASGFWASFLQIATVVVVVGVVIEVVATILEVRDEFAEGKPAKVHHVLTFIGGALVVLAVAAEYGAENKGASIETKLRANNAAAQGELDKRAREATAEAVAIANKFGGLQQFVAKKEGEMDSAFVGFKTFAGQQQALEKKEISDLNGKQAKLDTALSSAEANAGKAASAEDVANKAAASMTDTLNSERQMQGQMRSIITRRILTPDQSASIVEKLKPFAKTPFDLFGVQDLDSESFMMQLSDALQKAGWDWKPAPNLGALVFTPKGKPPIAVTVAIGCSIEIAESAKPALNAPVLALANAILAAGVTCTPLSNKDSEMRPEFDKKWVHIFIGSRG